MPSNGSLPDDRPFLGGYWRFIRRWTLFYIYLLIAAAVALLVADAVKPEWQVFSQLRALAR